MVIVAGPPGGGKSKASLFPDSVNSQFEAFVRDDILARLSYASYLAP